MCDYFIWYAHCIQAYALIESTWLLLQIIFELLYLFKNKKLVTLRIIFLNHFN